MDPFHYVHDNVEAEQAGEIGRENRQVGSLARAFQTIELCVVLFFALCLFIRLPCVFKILAQLLRRLVLFIMTPSVILLILAVIAVVLMVKSFRVSNQGTAHDNAAVKFYEHMVNTGETYVFEEVEVHVANGVEDHMQIKEPLPVEDEEVYEDKGIVSEENTKAPICEIDDKGETDYSDGESKPKEVHEQPPSEIAETKREILCPRDQLSMEEFNKVMEDFIEKQRAIHREELHCDYMERLIRHKLPNNNRIAIR